MDTYPIDPTAKASAAATTCCGASPARLRWTSRVSKTDYAGDAYEAVRHDCAEGAAWFGVSSLPTVILNEKLSLVGTAARGGARSCRDEAAAEAPAPGAG